MISSVDDVDVRFFRSLTVDERPLVEARLQDAEDAIRSRIPDLDERAASDPVFARVVRRVAADAVIRLVRNPEGYTQETDGNYTYILAQSHADGRLSILESEWRDLGFRRRVSVVHVLPELPWVRS